MFKKIIIFALFSVFLGGCIPLITADIRSGLQVEAYEPASRIVRHEYLPTYSWGGGGVYSNGSTEVWDGYGYRDGKVVRVYENVYGGNPPKSIFSGKRK